MHTRKFLCISLRYLGRDPAMTVMLENVTSSCKAHLTGSWLYVVILDIFTQELFLMAFPKKNQAC